MTKLNAQINDLAGESETEPFDCVIVGGGSSGMTLARTLSDKNSNLRIVILEAGSSPFLTHISNTELRYSRNLERNVRNQTAYNQTLANGENFGTFYSCLGGRGLFWNGASPRFRAHDFTNWPSGLNLNSAYDWAESEFRVTTSVGQTPLARSIINAINTNTNLKAEPGPFAVDYAADNVGALRAGIASGFSLFFRGAGDAIMNDHIQIATNAFAEEIIHTNGEATAVVVRDGTSTETHAIKCRSVALAAGGIESILLAQKSNLPDDSGRIGWGLQEHLFYDCWFNGVHLYQSNQPDTAIVYLPSTTLTSEQWELHAPGRSLWTLDSKEGWSPNPEERYRVMIRSFCATDKAANNYVEPVTGSGIGGAKVHWKYTDDDRRRQEQILKHAVQIKESMNLDVVGDLAVDSIERFRAPGSSYHEAGGLDMGTNPITSVTNIHGEFHKISNIINVDAASFPEIGATNPHLTIVALAHYKGLHLANKLSS